LKENKENATTIKSKKSKKSKIKPIKQLITIQQKKLKQEVKPKVYQGIS